MKKLSKLLPLGLTISVLLNLATFSVLAKPVLNQKTLSDEVIEEIKGLHNFTTSTIPSIAQFFSGYGSFIESLKNNEKEAIRKIQENLVIEKIRCKRKALPTWAMGPTGGPRSMIDECDVFFKDTKKEIKVRRSRELARLDFIERNGETRWEKLEPPQKEKVISYIWPEILINRELIKDLNTALGHLKSNLNEINNKLSFISGKDDDSDVFNSLVRPRIEIATGSIEGIQPKIKELERALENPYNIIDNPEILNNLANRLNELCKKILNIGGNYVMLRDQFAKETSQLDNLLGEASERGETGDLRYLDNLIIEIKGRAKIEPFAITFEIPPISKIEKIDLGLIEAIVDWLIKLGGVIAVLLIIIGGVIWLLVPLGEKYIELGKNYIFYALLGYFLLLVSKLIISLLKEVF